MSGTSLYRPLPHFRDTGFPTDRGSQQLGSDALVREVQACWGCPVRAAGAGPATLAGFYVTAGDPDAEASAHTSPPPARAPCSSGWPRPPWPSCFPLMLRCCLHHHTQRATIQVSSCVTSSQNYSLLVLSLPHCVPHVSVCLAQSPQKHLKTKSFGGFPQIIVSQKGAE